jgi:hypothetical protein
LGLSGGLHVVSETIAWKLEFTERTQRVVQHDTTHGSRRANDRDWLAVALNNETLVPIVDAIKDVREAPGKFGCGYSLVHSGHSPIV